MYVPPWPQNVARRVTFKAFLSSDHLTPATGKTIAVVISKNGAAFGNPSGGATNATEIGNGWYYVDLTTTDNGTAGPVIVRGTEGTIDPAEMRYDVLDDRFYRATKAITKGTVGAASSTTSVVTSSLDPSASATDQYKGQILCFDKDTTTTGLRGQKTDITASTTGGVLTVTALSHAPVSGDTFTIQ